MTSLVLACASETPPPSGPVATPPPSRPATPPTPDAAASPAPAPTPPPTAGTGGSSGTGGTGGAGGTGGSTTSPPDAGVIADAPPAIPACGMTTVATGIDPLIDDFNDNDAVIRLVDGRMGEWANGQRADVELASMINPEIVTIMGMNRALRYRGTAPAGAFAQVETRIAEEISGCYDASTYGGIQLAIRGLANTRVRVWVQTGDLRALGDARFGEYYHKDLTITGSMNTFRNEQIRWEEFEPGLPAPEPRKLNPALIYGLIVSAIAPLTDAGVPQGAIGMFDFTIDNVQFIPKTAAPPARDAGTRQ
jgi:hypothetical protein